MNSLECLGTLLLSFWLWVALALLGHSPFVEDWSVVSQSGNPTQHRRDCPLGGWKCMWSPSALLTCPTVDHDVRVCFGNLASLSQPVVLTLGA